MKKKATGKQIEAVLKKVRKKSLEPLVMEGEERKVIGIKGDLSQYSSDDFFATGVEDIKRITRPYKLVSREFKPKDSVIEINKVKIGGNNPPVIIAGPCAVEEYPTGGSKWMVEIAQTVKEAGADMLRGGAFKPRSNPYSFQGLGEKGLEYLAEAERLTGLPIVSEAAGEKQVDLVGKYVKVIQIGTRNAKAYELLKQVGEKTNSPGKAVLLKRGENATIKEFLQAAEYIAYEGCMNIILCLRGIRTYENKENGFKRYTADLDSIPILKKESHFPVIFDPSHASGDSEYVKDLSLAAIALGADGLMIETHPDPDNAWSDARQQITPEALNEIVRDIRSMYINSNRRYDSLGKETGLPEMRKCIDQLDNALVNILSRRNELVGQIAEHKRREEIPVYCPDRENELLMKSRQLAGKEGVSPEMVKELFETVMKYSREIQERWIRDKK